MLASGDAIRIRIRLGNPIRWNLSEFFLFFFFSFFRKSKRKMNEGIDLFFCCISLGLRKKVKKRKEKMDANEVRR